MPSSSFHFNLRGLSVSHIQKFIPRKWKETNSNSDISMIDSLLIAIKNFTSQGHLSKAFKTYSLVQNHVSSSTGCSHDIILLRPISSLLTSCTSLKSLSEGKQLHAHIIVLGFEQYPSLVPKLVTFYTSFNLLVDAHVFTEKSKIFHPLPWNLLIFSYVKNGFFCEALSAYKQMVHRGIRPDNFTYPAVLKACGEKMDVAFGREVHMSIEHRSMEWSLFVHNALVAMYGKFGLLDIAHHLFDKMPKRDAVSWNAMISVYASRGMWNEAFELFESMWMESNEVNVITWNTIAGGCVRTGNFMGALKLLSQMSASGNHLDSVGLIIGLNACSHMGVIKLGKEIHGFAVRGGIYEFENLKNALITMYSRCEDLRHAYTMFQLIEEKNIITWNSMISGYTRMDRAEEASFLFREMLLSGFEPNYVTIASILPLCARVANLQHGKEFHCYIIKRKEFGNYLLLWNAIVDMYARSGKIFKAKKVFDSLTKRDKVTYTSMMSGYGMQGEGQAALKLFEEMTRHGIKPDHVTMVAILSACSHSGLVMQGKMLFEKMSSIFDICPRLEHYACMVDLYGRAGLIKQAKETITRMPYNYRPTPAMWATLIGACRIHGNVEIGEWAAENLLAMRTENSGYYVLIANMYAAAGNWNKLARVRTFMRDLGVRKSPGCAWVDVGNGFSPFLVGDTSKPDIYLVSDGLTELMKDAGYTAPEDFDPTEDICSSIYA